MKTLVFPAIIMSALGTGAYAEVTFPSDYKNTCGISANDFNGWFQSGTAQKDGSVKPADGFTFPPVENTTCDFYKWGAQMFLWLTSSDSGAYTFDGPDFYDVVETGSSTFEFQQATGAEPNMFRLRDIKSEDVGGTGQAGGSDVLLSQKASLAYYGIHANDIYANYLTGQKAGKFASTAVMDNFPHSQEQMALVELVLKRTFANPQAMTMELKTSWVEASTVEAARYLTIAATVPKYDRNDDAKWTYSGMEIMELALVGMHIAAPVNGHPELVWSSFEHVDNAPNASYYYLNSGGTATLAAFDGSGDWTFFPTDGAAVSSIKSVASVDSDGNIVAGSGGSITPVSVNQINPWGLSQDEASEAEANTDLVSLNATVLGMLSGLGDVRGNYYQIGGIWTVEGQIPTGDSDANIRGGDRLANSTMETFHQYPDENNRFTSKNCFLCHSVSSGSSHAGQGIYLSHIFEGLQPLPE